MIAFQDPQNPTTTPDTYRQLPELISTFQDVDDLFYFTVWMCAFFFLLIVGILAYTVVKHRRKTWEQPAESNVTHHTTLEVVWTVIPLIIVMVVFAWGWKGTRQMYVAPADALDYKVVGYQWAWDFYHPGDAVASTGDVWVPLGEKIKFTSYSKDVLHSLYIPGARLKKDVLPGRFQVSWFEPTTLGDYHIFCTEYCGDRHSMMIGRLHIVTPTEYAQRPWAKQPDIPQGETYLTIAESNPELHQEWIDFGESIYLSKCASCHSLDGSPMTGPSWKGIWGRKQVVTIPDTGATEEVVNDEAYITESIRMPAAKYAAGFPAGGMNAFDESQIPEDHLQFLFAFMQTLSTE